MNFKDFFNSDNVKNYIQGNYNYFQYKLHDGNIEDHVMEQALYRAYLCQPCLVAGKCTGCSCTTPNLFFAPDKVDHDEKWGAMLSKEKWEEFKKENEIDSNIRGLLDSVVTFKSFTPKQFLFRGKPVFHKMYLPFVMLLDEILDDCKIPFRIINSYLDQEFMQLNGEKNTFHEQGKAVDIAFFNSKDLARIVKACLNRGLSLQITPTYLHIDCRNPKEQILFL
jgi:hypothetical protein